MKTSSNLQLALGDWSSGVDREPSSSASDHSPLRKVAEFPHFGAIAHGDLLSLSLSANTSALTHSLHRFPAKYIPQVPRWALREFATESSVVLDPFMGSGTTLVEGLCCGARTIGIDIDPLARLIARAKTAEYRLDRLHAIAAQLLSTKKLAREPFLPMHGVVNVEHWFNRSAWEELCSIFAGIGALRCSDDERAFFLCVFSSVLRWVSNADDQTQKTYVSGTNTKTPPAVRATFAKHLNKALSGVAELERKRRKCHAEILAESALSMPLDSASVDLIVTSPPYLDSVDYMYNFMLEYFWLGPSLGVASRSDYNARRRLQVGAKRPTDVTEDVSEGLRNLVSVGDIPPYRRAAVLGYFDSMRQHFMEAHRVLKNDARYVLVVGNSQIEAGVIPVHECLLRLAREAGLQLEKAFAYRIRRHYMKFPRKGRGGIILMDWVITLRKRRRPMLKSEGRLPIPSIAIGEDEVAH